VNAKTISKVTELVHVNQQITIIEIVDEVGISYGSEKAILKEELQMRLDETRWILHHDNAASYMSMAVQLFLVEKQITLMLQPLYVTDLTSCKSGSSIY
jgi:hypothetical protein